VSESIQALAASPDKTATERLLRYVGTNSFHQRVAARAITALRARRDATVLPAFLDAVKKRWDEFPTSVQASAIETAAALAADEDSQRSTVREFLVAHVNDGRERIQIAAIRGLGTLRDEKAIAVLETFATAAKESPTRTPAEAAINAIRSGRRAGNEAQALRTEVMDLKKENRELRDELKGLSKKVDALAQPAKTNANEKTKTKPEKTKRPSK
jgi:aminopeptidase N